MQNSKRKIFSIVAFISLVNVALLAEMNLAYVGFLGIVLIVLLVYNRPETLLIIFVVATSTTTPIQHFPKLNMGAVDFYFTDSLMILAFVIMFIKSDVRANLSRIRNPVVYSLLTFMALVVIGILHTIGDEGMSSLTKSIAIGRELFYYLLIIPAIAFLKDEEKALWFVKAIIVLSILVSCYIIFTAVFGRTIIHIWLKTAILKRSIEAVNVGSTEMVLRQGRLKDIPGISFIIIMLPLVIGLIVYNWRGKSLHLYYSALFLGIIVIIVNFTRTVWVSYIVMGILMLFLVRSKGHRYISIAIASTVFFIVATIILMLVPKYSDIGIISFMSKRFISFFVDNINTGTAIQRIVETKAALGALDGNYFWGIGISNTLERVRVMYNDQEYYLRQVASLHNSYINFIFKIGLPSLIAYLILSYFVLKRSYLLFKTTERSFVKGISIGIFLSYIRIMMNAVSQHYFWYMSTVTPIVYLFALCEVLIDLERKRRVVESPSTTVVKREPRLVSIRR